ncbi:hypothetical protein G6F24_015010 [Rhizopus arrhizus]|nr:hypothetical protein G6F24_015010 [Rhizopus arrhizus]
MRLRRSAIEITAGHPAQALGHRIQRGDDAPGQTRGDQRGEDDDHAGGQADPQPFQAGRHDGFRLVIPARIEHLHQVVEQVETTDRQHRRTQRGDRDGQRDLASDALAFGVHHSVQEAVADAADGGGNADHAHVLQLAPQHAAGPPAHAPAGARGPCAPAGGTR